MSAASPQDFAVRLRSALAVSGLSQRQLADAVGVSENTVTSWATGRYRPAHRNLRRIAIALGVTLDELHEERVPRGAPSLSVRGSADDSLGTGAAAQRIVEQLARIDLDAPLDALHRSTPDLMRLLSDARRVVRLR